jgi:hypothetical protein
VFALTRGITGVEHAECLPTVKASVLEEKFAKRNAGFGIGVSAEVVM